MANSARPRLSYAKIALREWQTTHSDARFPTSALILACGATVPELVKLRKFVQTQILCVEQDNKRRLDLFDTFGDDDVVHVVKNLPPLTKKRNAFDIIIAPPVAAHASYQPLAITRKLGVMLKPDGVAIFSYDGAQAWLGAEPIRHAISLLTRYEDGLHAQFRLAMEILQSLPNGHWLSSARLRQRGIKLNDTGAMYDHFIRARPTPPLHLFDAISLIHKAGLTPTRTLREKSYLRHERWMAANDVSSHLSGRSKELPLLWRMQLGEFVSGNILTHSLVVRKGNHRTNFSCSDTRALRMSLPTGSLNEGIGFRSASSKFDFTPLCDGDRTHPPALISPPKSSVDSSLTSSYSPQPLVCSTLDHISQLSHRAFEGRFGRRFCGRKRPLHILVSGDNTGDETIQLSLELQELHSTAPHCEYNRSTIVHVDSSADSIDLTRARFHKHGIIGANAPAEAPKVEPRIRLVSDLEHDKSFRRKFDFVSIHGIFKELSHSIDRMHIFEAMLAENGVIHADLTKQIKL